MTVRILVFGARGQLGTAVTLAASGYDLEIVAAPRSADVSDAVLVRAQVELTRPDWIVNCAAMTDVDRAHRSPSLAMAVNALGPANIALAATNAGARVVQISTEAVFDGEQQQPYHEDDACHPVSTYGAAKLAGESLALIYAPDSLVLRTSWLYSGAAGINFPTRLLRQLVDPEQSISVVTDVVGNPTPTSVLAAAIVAVILNPPTSGLYHICCLDPASKYEWAVEIAESAGHDPSRIAQVTSADYPTVALRPKHVDLSCEKFLATQLFALPNWRDAWRESMALGNTQAASH